MFGAYPSGEIIYASILNPITGIGGINEAFVMDAGQKAVGDTPETASQQ